MTLAGLVLTLLGFLISIASLTLTTSVGGRMGIVIAGFLISLAGIIGLINPAYTKNAIWRK